jgi:hypothetical protein
VSHAWARILFPSVGQRVRMEGGEEIWLARQPGPSQGMKAPACQAGALTAKRGATTFETVFCSLAPRGLEATCTESQLSDQVAAREFFRGHPMPQLAEWSRPSQRELLQSRVLQLGLLQDWEVRKFLYAVRAGQYRLAKRRSERVRGGRAPKEKWKPVPDGR